MLRADPLHGTGCRYGNGGFGLCSRQGPASPPRATFVYLPVEVVREPGGPGLARHRQPSVAAMTSKAGTARVVVTIPASEARAATARAPGMCPVRSGLGLAPTACRMLVLASRVEVFDGLSFGEDFVGGLGPREEFSPIVPAVDEDLDGVDELLDAGEGAAADR